MDYKPKIGGRRKTVIEKLKTLISKYPIIAVVNMENLPAKQLQRLRNIIRDDMELFMTKKRLMKIALKESETEKKGVSALSQFLRGMPALIFTEKNPFSLFRILKENKSQAPAKAGQTAPNDIYVEAGPTPFAPGPIIGELGAIGIKSGVENGKVAIKERTLVVKEGETIQPKVAEILTRLNIEPMEVGLNLTAAFENGELIDKNVLDIDEQEYYDNLINTIRLSFNFAVELGYAVKETIEAMVIKAHSLAKGLAYEQDILTDENVKDIISKAKCQADALMKVTG